MLNTDGKLTDEWGGCAGIFRRTDGSVMMAYHKGSNGTSIGYIEIEAILLGLQIAKNAQVTKIQVRTNSLEAFNNIINICKPTWRNRNMVNRIKAKMQDFDEANIGHIFRETNRQLIGLLNDVFRL
ncbi:hypothetical protein FRX31_022824, partial [Thalictrum thalictroides]